jgi:hypothetical protein
VQSAGNGHPGRQPLQRVVSRAGEPGLGTPDPRDSVGSCVLRVGRRGSLDFVAGNYVIVAEDSEDEDATKPPKELLEVTVS